MNVTSDRLKKLRMSQGYTKSDIAREVGVTRRAVYAWEETDKLPEISRIIRLAQFYQVSVDYLLGLTDTAS